MMQDIEENSIDSSDNVNGDSENWTSRNYDIEVWDASFGIRYAKVVLLVLLAIFMGGSLTFVFSATAATSGYHMMLAQLRWMIIGGCAMALFCWIPLHVLYRFSLWMLVAVALCLAYLAIAQWRVKSGGLPFAPPVKGAVRWLRIGGLQIQPSECAKFCLALYLGAYYDSLQYAKTRSFVHGILLPMIPVGGTLALMVLGKDLSSTMLTGGMVFVMMFMGCVRFSHIVMVFLLGCAVAVFFVCVSPERISRVKSWTNPDENADDGGYQVQVSQRAMAKGGLTGMGRNQGIYKGWLPENHTDFIVAVIGEETGMLGVYCVLLGYLSLCGCIVAIARASRHLSDTILGLGIAVLIAAQALINIGVVSNLGPTTGVTAPFLSYGGTSMVVMCSLIGLILNVSRRNTRDIIAKYGDYRITL